MRRLDSCSQKRLIVWDLAGPDAVDNPVLAVVPSEDIRPTASQRQKLAENAQKNVKWTQMPSLSAMLSQGFRLSEYCIGQGPQAWLEGTWAADMWELLDAFASQAQVCHPPGRAILTPEYRLPMKSANQILANQLLSQMADGGLDSSEPYNEEADEEE